MGCGLRKIRQTDDSSPGKIYSTLKRPQVETKIGVAYTYAHVDFLVGKEDVTSTLCLSSVRELPSQLQDLYQQGYVLIAVHPFVHPCGPEVASVQRQLYRAVLSKVPESSEKSPSEFEPYHLKLEECLSADHTPTPEHIQGYVKKQIQDAADQGILFSGFIQEPAGLHHRVTSRGGLAEASLSLHSSPSSLRCSELTASPSHQGESGAEDWAADGEGEEPRTSRYTGGDALSDVMSTVSKSECCDGEQDDIPSPNNKPKEGNDKPCRPTLGKCGAELFGLFNYPGGRQQPLKYYTVKVPLRVQPGDEGSRAIEAQWLDHMTQHFNNGASLVDGYFSLAKDDDSLPTVIDSVFIFQEGDASASATYDAIVVEQWTVINGVQVKTDYIPLLQSLASFGWKLTCVLPTPVIKNNSDGSVSTKQIVFFQRPTLVHKRRHSKKIIFRSRKNSSKNSVKETLKSKKKKKNAPEKEQDDPKTRDGARKENEPGDDAGTAEKERADCGEVEAEVRREMDDNKLTNGKQEEAGDEIETLPEAKNGEAEGEEVKRREEENHRLHNGLDEQETSTNQARDANEPGAGVEHNDPADRE